MALQVAVGSPLAEALQTVVQPKLVEVGWSTSGVDDSALSEYIILMLVNGKTQDQIASELSQDLLGLGPEDRAAVDFSQWLFEQLERLHRELDGDGSALPSGQNGAAHLPSGQFEASGVPQISQQAMGDTSMASGTDVSQLIPTAPKSMRGPAPNGRDKRLINQINHNLDRNPDTTLRRIRAAPGTGRVNSHSREPPKGPRVQGAHFRNGAGARPANGHSGPQPGAYPQALPAATMTPQQQMQLLAMYEEQARMMARILSSEQLQDINNMHIDPATSGPNAQHRPSQGQASGRSLFERVEATPSNLGHRKHFQPDHILGSQGDDQMSDAPHIPSSLTTASTNDGDSTAKDPTVTLCRFNLTCTKSDCQFAHQSPAAPAGTTIDMTDTCSFGAACKNRKCTGRHPSAAQKSKHQAVQNCKFYPNCTNQKCPFLHPDMPACRNGADCTVTNCKFAHSKIECRYNPCLNPACPFKHIAGQKRGAFEDKVWVASSDLKEEHVSDRKFVVDEDVEEELILPGQSSVSPTIPKVDVAVA